MQRRNVFRRYVYTLVSSHGDTCEVCLGTKVVCMAPLVSPYDPWHRELLTNLWPDLLGASASTVKSKLLAIIRKAVTRMQHLLE